MQDRLKFRVYFKGSEYAEAGYVDLTRRDVIFSLRADGQIIRNVVYDCQHEGHERQPCNMPFTPNNNLYDIQFCTGLKDKNGKLIYEGDILKVNTGSRDTSGYGVVEYMQCGCNFVISGFLDNPSGYHPRKKSEFCQKLQEWLVTEVIGNIYENPKLLENKE